MKYDAPLFCSTWARTADQYYVICGGGGGDGNNGVRNLLVVAPYDPETRELSNPVHTLLTDRDYARALAMHPNANEFVCAFPENKSHKGKLKKFKLVMGKDVKLQPLPVDHDPPQFENLGEQRSLAFSLDGKLFATGGQDGHLRVFRWPKLGIVLDRADAHNSIKDLDFSLDGAFLVATDDSGPSRVWDLKNLSSLAALPLNRAGFCRFSRDEARPCLYVTSAEGGNGHITVWNFQWKKISSKKVMDEPISAFNISSDGKLLAIASPGGEVSILKTAKLSVLQRVKNCHMVLGTSVSFSHDSKWLLSVSADSSVRVLPCEASYRGWRLAVVLWMILLAAVLISLVLSNGGLKGILESSRQNTDSHDLI